MGQQQQRLSQVHLGVLTPGGATRLSRMIPGPRDEPIPANMIPHDQYKRASVVAALHEVLQRSPDRKPARTAPSTPSRYYQYVKDLALSPVALTPGAGVLTIMFLIEPDIFANIVEPVIQDGGRVPVCFYGPGSLRYRLKTIRARKEQRIGQHQWVVTDHDWPSHIFLKLNDSYLQPQRKAQNSKDIPLELSRPTLRVGENTIQLSIPRQINIEQGWEYLIAVEAVETQNHQFLMSTIPKYQLLSAEMSRAAIQRRITGGGVENDEDVALVTNDLPIDLADPWSATIWDIPVRGRHCTHLECFDLATWLTSRPTKPCLHGGPPVACHAHCRATEPTLTDKWKCPNCDQDARPFSLVVDGFLLEVREQLARENKLRTVKSIWVSADGTWKPKTVQEDDGSDETDDEDLGIGSRGGGSGPPQTSELQQRPAEVIELE